MSINERFGKAVEFFIEQSDFSQNEVALYSGLGSSTKLRNIISGKSTMTVATIEAFCQTLNVSMSDLFKKVEEM